MSIRCVSTVWLLMSSGYSLIGALVASRPTELVKDRAAKASFNTAERAAVATMSGLGWLGFVVGPPLIAYFADVVGLTSAPWTLPAFMVAIAVVVRHPVFGECHWSRQTTEA